MKKLNRFRRIGLTGIGIAESRMTAERNKFVCAAVRTLVKGATKIGITTANDLTNFCINNGTHI